MIKQIVSALFLALYGSFVLAQAPAGYYDSVDASSGSSLKASLHEIIDDHVRFPYTSTATDTWDIINEADEDALNPNNILDIYKNASYPKISGGTGAYNREHSWPKSYGFPKDNSSNYPYTDAHHLFASDASYNSSRSNNPYRDCDASCDEKVSQDTNGRGGGSGVYPGNSNWRRGTQNQEAWQTWVGRKGDVARAMFYMAVRYEGGIHGTTEVVEPDLELTDDLALIEASNTGVNESLAYMGMLSDLVRWHQEDPVDAIEIRRNDVVYSFQGNRNPFIDNPAWADCIFGAECSGGGSNEPPAVVIFGGDRTIPDSDGVASELVSFTATATDSDGSIVSSEWLINEAVVATGLTPDIPLSDGESVLTFRATDDDGEATSTNVTITVEPPNQAPSVGIAGGDRTIPDSDGIAGETVNLSAIAADGDGTINSSEWLINNVVVAMGLTPSIPLPDGATGVTFRATDDDEATTSTSVTLTVEPPNQSPVVNIAGGNRTIADSNGTAGETISFSAAASDADGTIVTTEWLVDSTVVASGTFVNIELPDGASQVSVRVADDDDATATDTVTISVEAPEPNYQWPAPYSGVTPDESLELGFNNIGVFSPNDGYIYTCVNGFTEGLNDLFSGAEMWDIAFQLVPSEEIILRVANSREFNVDGALNEIGELPDCSGQFDSSTSTYTDIVEVGADTLGLTFELVDSDNLNFRLQEIDALLPPPPNEAPVVSIVSGDQTIADSDGAAGEIVGFSASAIDSDGTISSTEWLINQVVVATGLSPNIALPDGVTILTFRATDNDGDSSSLTVALTVNEPEPEEWPSPYNGVTPDASLGLEFNNIGFFNPDDGLIYTCLRIVTNIIENSIDGIERFDIAFELALSEDIILRINNIRQFNSGNVLNENSELPDCSGAFETTNGKYTDLLQVGIDTFEVRLGLIQSEYLDFKLESATVLEPN